jgi:hypothetical protein
MLLLLQDPCSLVAVWVTNRPRMHRFAQEQLLPAWGLTHVATWLWLKVEWARDVAAESTHQIDLFYLEPSVFNADPLGPHEPYLASFWVGQLPCFNCYAWTHRRMACNVATADVDTHDMI